jgi:hypothetical protein
MSDTAVHYDGSSDTIYLNKSALKGKVLDKKLELLIARGLALRSLIKDFGYGAELEEKLDTYVRGIGRWGELSDQAKLADHQLKILEDLTRGLAKVVERELAHKMGEKDVEYLTASRQIDRQFGEQKTDAPPYSFFTDPGIFRTWGIYRRYKSRCEAYARSILEEMGSWYLRQGAWGEYVRCASLKDRPELSFVAFEVPTLSGPLLYFPWVNRVSPDKYAFRTSVHTFREWDVDTEQFWYTEIARFAQRAEEAYKAEWLSRELMKEAIPWLAAYGGLVGMSIAGIYGGLIPYLLLGIPSIPTSPSQLVKIFRILTFHPTKNPYILLILPATYFLGRAMAKGMGITIARLKREGSRCANFAHNVQLEPQVFRPMRELAEELYQQRGDEAEIYERLAERAHELGLEPVARVYQMLAERRRKFVQPSGKIKRRLWLEETKRVLNYLTFGLLSVGRVAREIGTREGRKDYYIMPEMCSESSVVPREGPAPFMGTSCFYLKILRRLIPTLKRRLIEKAALSLSQSRGDVSEKEGEV